MDKPKIAVCLSGQLRKLGQPDHKNIFRNADVDYFIHTWDHKYNPNLNEIDILTHYPNATIQVEKYETDFDNIIEELEKYKNRNWTNDEIREGSFRYHFAQYYTIIKSLNMCYNHYKDYDFIIRLRTDIDIFNSEAITDNTSNDHLVELFYKCYQHYSVNSKGNDIDHFENNIKPSVASYIQYIQNDIVSIRDWIWTANTDAFRILGQLSAKDTVKLAYDIMIENNFNWSVAPVVWPHIFFKYGICLAGNYNGRMPDGRCIRDPNIEKTHHYGEVDE